jgi:hypothetical protein
MKLILFLRLSYRSYTRALKFYFIVLAGLLLCNSSHAESILSKKDKLKAAYLLNFTQFIEWPNKEAEKTPTTIRICVDGSSEFLLFLNQMAETRNQGLLQKTIKALPLTAAKGCELLYVKESNAGKFDFINLERIDNTVIVTDSNEISFPKTSIVFYEQNKNLRFEIDLQQINEAQVIVSSELLKLARIK